jgi:transcription elongation factor GreB
MSRAFVKEDDAGEPPIIPPRAALPPGTTNYVTPRGLTLLRQELASLEAERTQAEGDHEDEANRTRQLTILKGRISALMARLASAKVVAPRGQPFDEVRFGATVTLQTRRGGKPGQARRFTIVGVDEASAEAGYVAFVAPIARTLTGARLGQLVTLRLGRAEEEVEVMTISYDAGPDIPVESS